MLLLIRRSRPRYVDICHQFTFHYASTYTPLILFNTGFIILFTFHYASTYTDAEYCPAYSGLYLHSTMLLLIPITQPGVHNI